MRRSIREAELALSSDREDGVRYVSVGDVSLAYQLLGDGEMPIVYVPGLLNLIESRIEEPALARHLDALTGFGRLVLFDKRGTGLSDRVPASEMADAQRRVEDVGCVMDAAGLDRAVLFATADGCAIAMRFAALHPERVQALVLIASTARMLPAEGYDAGIALDLEQLRPLWQERWGNEENPLSVELVAPSVEDDPRWRAALARIQRRAGTPGAAFSYWRAIVEMDSRELLADVRAPTLVVHAAGDRLVPVAQGRFVAEAIPGASYLELPDGEHLFFFKDADPVMRRVEEFLTGGRGPHVDRRLATVVFGDIVGSTETAARLGDRRWRDLLESHDGLVRSGLRRFGGEEVKFTGDGFLVLFSVPDDALDFSLTVVEDVRALGVELRVGIHTGTIEVRDGDIAGLAVNVAARLLGHADGSEVVVTRTVRDLLGGGDRPAEPLGRHSLKGIPDEWELYRIGP